MKQNITEGVADFLGQVTSMQPLRS